MRGGIENLSPCSFNLPFPPPFPPSCLLFSLLLLFLSLSHSAHMFLCSRFHLAPFCCFHSSLPPFLRPTSRRQVVVNRTIISSSQMHFAPLLHSDKLNIPSKHFFQGRRHLMFCFHGSANLTSGPLDSQTAFYLHRRILQHQNLHAFKDLTAARLLYMLIILHFNTQITIDFH